MLRFRSLLLTATVGFTAALSSCSSIRYFDFTTASSRQSAYHASVPKATPALAAVVNEAALEAPLAADAAPVIAEPTLTASAAPAAAAVRPPAPAAVRLSEQFQSARAERQLTRAQERRYERVLNRVQRAEQQAAASAKDVNIVEVILCLIFPLGILAVYLHEGGINSKFWITLLLSLLILPGIIYALLVVLDVV